MRRTLEMARRSRSISPDSAPLRDKHDLVWTFDVGRRFRCTMRVDCGQIDPGAVIQPVLGEWQTHIPERLDEEELADWQAGRKAIYQLAALTIGSRLRSLTHSRCTRAARLARRLDYYRNRADAGAAERRSVRRRRRRGYRGSRRHRRGDRMRRRELMLLLVGAMTAARALRAQQKAMPVVGFLGSTAPASYTPFVAAFLQGLNETGYIEGQNVAIDYRWADGSFDRLPASAADLVSSKVDVIVTSGGPVPARAATSASATIPVVSVLGGDPIADGLIASLARPGGNLTGVTFMMTELTPKRFELLVPQAGVIALLVNPNDAPSAERTLRDVQEAARSMWRQIRILKAGTESEIDSAFATLVQLHIGSLFVGADAFFNSRRRQLVALAAQYAIPAIYEWREF